MQRHCVVTYSRGKRRRPGRSARRAATEDGDKPPGHAESDSCDLIRRCDSKQSRASSGCGGNCFGSASTTLARTLILVLSLTLMLALIIIMMMMIMMTEAWLASLHSRASQQIRTVVRGTGRMSSVRPVRSGPSASCEALKCPSVDKGVVLGNRRCRDSVGGCWNKSAVRGEGLPSLSLDCWRCCPATVQRRDRANCLWSAQRNQSKSKKARGHSDRPALKNGSERKPPVGGGRQPRGM